MSAKQIRMKISYRVSGIFVLSCLLLSLPNISAQAANSSASSAAAVKAKGYAKAASDFPHKIDLLLIHLTSVLTEIPVDDAHTARILSDDKKAQKSTQAGFLSESRGDVALLKHNFRSAIDFYITAMLNFEDASVLLSDGAVTVLYSYNVSGASPSSVAGQNLLDNYNNYPPNIYDQLAETAYKNSDFIDSSKNRFLACKYYFSQTETLDQALTLN